jgi:hypothetical protein
MCKATKDCRQDLQDCKDLFGAEIEDFWSSSLDLGRRCCGCGCGCGCGSHGAFLGGSLGTSQVVLLDLDIARHVGGTWFLRFLDIDLAFI